MAKELEHWQVEDAKRLKDLFDQNAKTNQTEFAIRQGIGTQGMLWQYMNARRPLNLAVVASCAEGLGVSIDDISPTLAAQVREIRSKLKGEAKWPFRSVDEMKVSQMDGQQLAHLEAALLISAAQLGLDVKK